MSNDVMSKRTYLVIKACEGGANFWTAQEGHSLHRVVAGLGP